MYSGLLPKTGAGLAVAGLALSILDLMWLAVAMAVIGGTLITLAKFGPRVALEPVPVGVRGSRFRFTGNGHPVTFRRARHRR